MRGPRLEFLIVVALILVFLGVAVVNVATTRSCRQGWETSTIATLRNISSAQKQFVEAIRVDLDGDGRGEVGTFGELSGAARLRGGEEPLHPPLLSGAFRSPDRDGVLKRSGYHFRIYMVDCDGRAVHELGSPPPEPTKKSCYG